MSFRGAKRTRNPEVRDSPMCNCTSEVCASRRIRKRANWRVGSYACKSHRALQRVGEVGLLPREPALIVRRAAEMAVGRGSRVNRLVEIEMLADAARRQIHRLGHGDL